MNSTGRMAYARLRAPARIARRRRAGGFEVCGTSDTAH